MILKNSRIVIPKQLRKQILEKIHTGHMGQEKCKQRARSTVFWPGITNEIINLVRQCEICEEARPSQKAEPLQPHLVPSSPWIYFN